MIETTCIPELKLDPQNMIWEVTPSKLLTDESPLIVLPQLSCKVGDRHATILQQLHYLTLNLRGKVVDGKKWIRIQLANTDDDNISWEAMMPYLKHDTIGKYLAELEQDGLVESKVFKGRCLWYWLNVEAVASLAEPVERVKGVQSKRLNNLTIAPSRSDVSPKSERCKPQVGANKAPSRVASKIVKNQSKTQKKKHVAPKNGAAQSDENLLADLPQNQSSEVNVNLGVVTPPPSSENPPQADKPRSPAQLAHDAKMSAFVDGLGWNLANAQSRGKILKAIGLLNGLYPDNTSEQITAVIAHLKRPNFKPSPTHIVEEWPGVMVELRKAEALAEMITAIKGIYKLSSLEKSREAELIATAEKLQKQGCDIQWVTNFPQIWRSHYPDTSVKPPSYRNLAEYSHLRLAPAPISTKNGEAPKIRKVNTAPAEAYVTFDEVFS